MSGMTGGDITTLTGNAGGLIPASGSGNFNIVGSGSIVVTGAPATHTLTISGGGVTGMTEHAMVVGNAAGGITSLAVATDGQLPIGSTGNNPVLATLTAGNNIGITNAAGSITIKVNGTTNHTVQVGNGTGDLTSLAVGATGVILQGVTASDPTWSTATYPSTVVKGDVLVASADNTIGVVNDVTNAGYVLTANVGAAPSFQAPPAGVTYASDAETIAGTVTNKAVAPSNLKAKLGTQTLHGLPIGASDSVAIAWTAEPTDGQILIGKTGNQPVLATISSGNNITATAGAGTISIAVTGTTQHAVQVGGAAGQLASLAVGTTGKYLRAATTADPAWSTLTLPDTVSKGDVLVASADNVVGSVAGATTAGHVLMANGAGSAPTFQALPPTGVTLTADDTNTASGASLTIAGGTNIGTTADGVSTLTINLDDTITLTQVNATTFDTNVVAAGTTLSGTTWAADGTDANIGLTLTPKGTGDVTVTVGDVAISSGNLTLPTSSSTVGQIVVNGSTWAHSYGSNSIYLGWSAGNFTYTGTGQNIGIGNNALKSTIAGYGNVSIGYNSAPTLNNQSECVIIGAEAGKALSYNPGSATSTGNIAIGYNALNTAYGNGNCSNMVVIGREACKYLQQNHQGSVVIGANALKNGGAGSWSTIIGTDVLTTYTGTGGNNTIIGAYACNSTNGANTFNVNTIIGYTAGRNLSVASNAITDNTFIGSSSANAMTSGSNLYNVFLGGNTGATITTGNIQNNTFLGYAAGNSYPAASVPTYCINIGSGCSGTGTESYVTRIGQATGANAQTSCYVGGVYNTAVGATAGVVLSDSDGKLGGLAGAANTIFVGGTKPSFTATPQCTDLTLTGNLYLSNTSSTVGRLISGSKVMMHFYDSNATYYSNTFIGWNSGNYTNTSSGTTCIGLYTGNSLSSGTEATIIGNEAGRRITSGNCNLLFGSLAGTNINTGKCNVVVAGRQGLDQITTGNYNLCLGHSSVANPTSAYGMYGAGHALTTSDSSNILIQAYGTSGWSNVLKIGDGTGTNAGQINTTYICGIYGKTPVGTMNVALVDSNNQLGSTSLLTPSLGGRNTIVNCTSSNSVTLAVNTTYIATSTNGSTKVVFTLPSTSAVGDEIKIIGASSAYYEVDQNSGNTIFYDNAGSTPGATGKLDVTASHRYTSITLTCITTDANWVVSSLTGAITLS